MRTGKIELRYFDRDIVIIKCVQDVHVCYLWAFVSFYPGKAMKIFNGPTFISLADGKARREPSLEIVTSLKPQRNGWNLS